MKCPHCNGEHSNDTKFCPKTGKKIEPMFKACKREDCHDYGKYILPLDAKFCPNCGKPLEGESSQNQDLNKINGHEYVDLGLTSGTLWATCNVGAESPSDYGDHFAWGETSPKSSYDWNNLKYRTSGDSYKNVKFSKYVTSSYYGDVDNMTHLDMQDDVASVNWGGSWRMPTKKEWEELYNNCTWQWTSQGGYNGYKVTSKKNGNSIFLSAAGYYYGSSPYIVGDKGIYWSSSLITGGSCSAFECYFSSSDVDPSSWGGRYLGRSVRPVSSSFQN